MDRSQEAGPDAADEPSMLDQDQGQDHNSPRKRKRTRVTKACELCRKRKEKCNGERPACGSCISLGRSCSYASESRRRGLPAGFIHSREVLLGLLLQIFDGAEDIILQALRADQLGYRRLAKKQCPQRACESLLRVWRRSRAAAELERVLEAAESREDDQSSQTPTFDSKLTALHNASCNTDLVAEGSTISSDHGIITPAATSSLVNEPDGTAHDDLPNIQQPDRTTDCASVSTSRPSVSALPIASAVPSLPETWPRLVELYMANTHCWLPVLEPHSLLRSSALISQHMPGSGQDCLLEGQKASFWSVLSFTLHQSPLVTPAGSPSQDIEPAQIQPIHAYSRQLALKDYAKYDLGHIHTFLLMALSHMGRSDWTSAWLWVGRAVYVAIDLGINITQKKQSISEVRPDDPGKRAFFSCFLFDTLVASRLGRRPHLQSDDLNQFEDFRTESLEEWDSWRPWSQSTHGTVTRTSHGPARILSMWNKLLYITRLLNRNLWADADNASCSGKEARVLLEELIAWQYGLPPQMRIIGDHGFAPIMDAPHSINLTLAMASLYLMLLASVMSDPENYATTVKARFPEQGWLQIIEFLRSLPDLDSRFSTGWMPPIFRIYLESLDKSRRILCPHLPGWGDAMTCVIDMMHKVWTHPHPDVPLSTWEAGFMPHATRPVQAVPDDMILVLDGFQNDPHATSSIAAESRLPCLREEQSTASTIATNVASALPQEVTSIINADTQEKDSLLRATGLEEVSRTSQSLSTDHDMLFNTLSSLDSVEWSGYDQEFIENLGFHGDTTLFNLQF
ncbi:hypothetical protein PFICI_14927 [Pestalotiopsis fici W106-1]|uniref:Zn(2)-C6 fungal-type domain-containing protein n=1 Tax=Pestalotiopsis fici (strain W106-1 / CGMCC3.15140) TaxID=1229662 RepID=W3WJL5_PESFW|nr:uncharacterized protein PFICI_14927 [Pestalotiopsis fici W106-1]ETS73322.1 hypothetical protein PFICI_14927 [Pestalotiopsis fici W106-1]